jgi:copper chaperone CopZ
MKTLFITLSTLGFLFSGESTATYKVDGMMCAMNCPKKVNNSLNGIDGIKSCKVDFESKTATVVFDDKKIDPDKIAKTISRGTYYKVMDINKKEKSRSFWNWLFGKN